MINKPVVNHLTLPTCPSHLLLYSRLRRAWPAAGYYYPPPWSFSAFLRTRSGAHPLTCDELRRNCCAHRAGCIARAPRIIGCIRCTGGRGGVTHLLATIAISHPRLDPSQREKSLRFSARSDISRRAYRMWTVTATCSSFSCRLIDDASFYELNPP